jgi:hypothetical protein
LRLKRGLLNIIGSVSKCLFGTLGNDDADLINANIDQLFQEGSKLQTIVGNQTALIQKIVNSDSLKQIEKVHQSLNEFQRNVSREEILTNLVIQKAQYTIYTFNSMIF